MWVNEMRYELQEIYGIANLVYGTDFDGNDPNKECFTVYHNHETLHSFLAITRGSLCFNTDRPGQSLALEV
nr:probable E3 ubiquitin-protein ligase LOG2 [Tanacetum cinerariifolium]